MTPMLEPSPLSPESLLETVRICERVAKALKVGEAKALAAAAPKPVESRGVLVTGGTGFLGKEIVRTLLSRGRPVRVVARREPSPWERIAGAEYVVADVATGAAAQPFKGGDTVIQPSGGTGQQGVRSLCLGKVGIRTVGGPTRQRTRSIRESDSSRGIGRLSRFRPAWPPW